MTNENKRNNKALLERGIDPSNVCWVPLGKDKNATWYELSHWLIENKMFNSHMHDIQLPRNKVQCWPVSFTNEHERVLFCLRREIR